MAKDPYAKCIRKLLRIVRSSNKRVIRAKKQLTKVLGEQATDPFPVKIVDCKFEIDKIRHEGRLSAGQCEALKEVLRKGGGSKDVVEKLHDLLKNVDSAAVEAQKSLSAALLASTMTAVQSAPCGPELGCCTYSVNGEVAKASCISKPQCDTLGGAWQLGPC